MGAEELKTGHDWCCKWRGKYQLESYFILVGFLLTYKIEDVTTWVFSNISYLPWA